MKLNSAKIFRVFMYSVVIMLLIHAAYECVEAGKRGNKRRGRKGKRRNREARRQRHSRRQHKNDFDDQDNVGNRKREGTYLDLYRQERSRLSPPLAPPLITAPTFDTWTEAVVKVASNNRKVTNRSRSHQVVGKFGYHSKKTSVIGKVVHVFDHARRKSNLGCNFKIANKEDIPENESWIALIKRGKCQFFHKIRLGETHNASAVVVYNEAENGKDDETIVMNTIGTDIPSLMISNKEGKKVVALLDAGNDVYMDIHVGKVHNETSSDASPTMPTSMGQVSENTTSNGRSLAEDRNIYLYVALFVFAFRLSNER